MSEHEHTPEPIYAFTESAEPNPIIGWTCTCGETVYFDEEDADA